MNIDTLTDVLLAIASIGAVVISITGLLLQKKAVVATSISASRIKWIEDVRTLTNNFLREYKKGEEGKSELLQINANIRLYLSRGNTDYIKLVNILDECLYKPYSDDIYIRLIDEAQDLFHQVWTYAKVEAGISKMQITASENYTNKIKSLRKDNQFSNTTLFQDMKMGE
jgi:hypothetical protein